MRRSAWPIVAVSLAFAVPALAQNMESKNKGVEPGTTSGTAAGTPSTAGNNGMVSNKNGSTGRNNHMSNGAGEPGRAGLPGSKSGPAQHKSNQQ
jgi:hypothetical protein